PRAPHTSAASCTPDAGHSVCWVTAPLPSLNACLSPSPTPLKAGADLHTWVHKAPGQKPGRGACSDYFLQEPRCMKQMEKTRENVLQERDIMSVPASMSGRRSGSRVLSSFHPPRAELPSHEDPVSQMSPRVPWGQSALPLENSYSDREGQTMTSHSPHIDSSRHQQMSWVPISIMALIGTYILGFGDTS
ncbi:hypothetical protein H1C71_007774, partial [Ictidomys tridecemlineatus]